ncbi:MAG: tRNA (N(6)-L-threonylcarbamoyladenosine(37)-C(2))-methylthiotransferase MtaB [Desulfatiglandales bacterium]
MNKTFKIVTLGCKVNQYESAYLRESLMDAEYAPVSEDEEADITVVNTCIVTQRAAYQSRQAIRKAIRDNPSGRTAAVGCYAQVFPGELAEIKGLALVAGNTCKGQLPNLLAKASDRGKVSCYSKDFPSCLPFEVMPIDGFPGRTRAFLKIQDGCRSFCSYCIVPRARGPLRSLEPEGVMSMLRSLSGKGYREVVLTGIHLGKYGADLAPSLNLKGLLRRIGREPLDLRVRLSSLHPDEMDGEMIDMVASEEWLCPHFHISLQSGNDRILRGMNRKYSASNFSALVSYIHRRMPLAAIGVDLIAGFPGETHEDFQDTFALIDRLPVSYLHVFPYSQRMGTPAAGLPNQVASDTKKERARALRKLGYKKRTAFYRSCMGNVFSVLVEGVDPEGGGMAEGWSENYVPVLFPCAQGVKNRLFVIRMNGLGKGKVLGEIQ